jgi:hypothetical protein
LAAPDGERDRERNGRAYGTRDQGLRVSQLETGTRFQTERLVADAARERREGAVRIMKAGSNATPRGL